MAEESKVVEDLKIKDELSDANTLTIENEDNDKISNEDDKYKDILEVKEDITKSKKKSLLSKILIGLIIFLFLLLAVGISLYFLGFFTPKEDTTPVVENSMPVEVKEETYKFDIKDINSKKLNEQLSFLTNKNINKEKNEELEKLENEKRREAEALKIKEEALLKEKEAIEEKKTQLENEKAELEAMKQEALMLKEQLEMNKSKLEANTEENKNTVIPVAIEKKENDIPTLVSKDKKFLKFINVAKIKGSLYKKYLDKVSSVNPNAILCRDDKNRIEIYFGPFEDDETRSNLLDKLIKNKFQEAYEVEFTKDEFDKRCNY